MSDFDREAEREKLREKYERDKKKREASERMSELLLQGATMTNRHCPECHSPVFRYEGRQFCPTCEREIAEEGEIEADEGPSETTEQTAGEETEKTEQSASDNEEPNRPDSDEKLERRERTSPDDEGTDPASETEDTPTPAGDRRPARVQPPARHEPGTSRDDRYDEESHRGNGDEFRDAEASLRREVGSLTRRAEETRDVGRKRELLAAAREAAETLEVVRRL